MSSTEFLREFISERLTAAAEEIFEIITTTIADYEEEINRQRRLLDIVWNPEIKLHRIELSQQHVFKEKEVLADRQLYILEKNSSLDQEDPEPPRIKKEQEELSVNQQGEPLAVKQETATNEESDHSEHQTLSLNPDETLRAEETEPAVVLPVINSVYDETSEGFCTSLEEEQFEETPTYEESDHSDNQTLGINESQNTEEEKLTSVKSSEVPEQNTDHQYLYQESCVDESQNQKRGKHGDSGSTRNAPRKRRYKRKSHANNVDNHTLSVNKSKLFSKCDTCEKVLYKCNLKRHMRVHTGEKPYLCKTCKKCFTDVSTFERHLREIERGEKPYSCSTCGKRFPRRPNLNAHIRIHSGDKQFH